MKTISGEEFRLRVPADARVALAFSGGRDSVALADLFLSSGTDFFAVHIEHGIRGENSLRDASFAERFCKERGIRLLVFRVDAPAFAECNRLTLEQAARQLRYGVFDGLLDGGECDYVALAHHADDQTETVLMRMLRGTGIKGLRGMSPLSGRYIRPLLAVSRAEIDGYIGARGLPFTEDETNRDESYTRNFLRAELARIRERFPAVNEAVARLARNAAEADDYIEAAAPYPEERDGEMRVPLAVFDEPVLAKRTVARACAALGVLQDVEEKHYDAVIGLVGAGTGKRVELSHGVTAHLDSDAVVFTRTRGRGEGDRAADGATEAPFPHGFSGEVLGVVLETVPKEQVAKGDGALYADADKIPDGAVLRKRRDGDVFTKFGGGTKNFGDFLTDRKVPLRRRDDITVCAVGNDVLFAAGVEISDKVRVDDDTVAVLKITLGKE